MGVFLAYTLKSAFLLALFYLLNRVLLEKETFHRLNRALWMLIIPLSYLLAFIDCGKDGAGAHVLGADHLPLVVDPGLIISDQTGTESLLATIVVLLLVVGSLILTIIWVRDLIRLKRGLRRTSSSDFSLLDECKNIAGVNIKVNLYVVNGQVVPYSWINNIIISETDIRENGREILLHELSHIKYGHSWDILLADLLIVVQWFNPASWLLKRAIRQVHEYQADDQVIKFGINAKQYQLLLIEKAVGKGLYSMANSFNHSKLKNRITMMLKEKSSKWNYAKCLYMIPLAFATLSVFAVPEVSYKMEEISNLEFKRFVSDAPQKTEKIGFEDGDPPLYIVDGNEVESVDDIPVEAVESVSVLKGDHAVQEYGERGRNGVIVITLKETGTYEAESGTSVGVRVVDGKKQGDEVGMSIDDVSVVSVVGRGTRYDTVRVDEAFGNKSSEDSSIVVRGFGPFGTSVGRNPDLLYIVDGNEVSEIESISSSDIESILVLKDQEATRQYGDKGKNGVIIITLKK